ncbi:MAG: four helix bundle suffix domain-containing protein [Pseudomonadota bacterium]
MAKKSGHCGQHGRRGQLPEASTESTTSTQSTKSYPELSANAALVLPAAACSLIDRQVERLARDFENEGGFIERLYRVRTAKRRSQP